MDDASSDIVTDSSVTTSCSPVSKKTTEGLFGDNDIIHRQVSKVGQSERSNNDQQSLTTEVAARGSDSFDDELFPTSSRGGATKSTNKQTTDLFMDNDDVDEIFEVKKKTVIDSVPKDDILGSGIMNTSTSQLTSKPISAVAPIVDDDIDDIFADTTANVKKGRKSTDRDILHSKIPSDDEDEMFGAASRPSVRQPKKAVTRDEDIFADDTDIFADLPASKPKSKKTMAMTSTGPTKSLFSSSDVDDIFADALSKPKPKVKKSLTPTKPSAVATPKGASIFDDDSPSIFDDPLNALGK
ncbi:hypothetical protein LSAT2_005893 [Lamellibrachia satsuma]|nr:hypothetical protein LSAT2_005893 [Lamellibrachia satsuma]